MLRSDLVECFSVAWDHQVNKLVLTLFSAIRSGGNLGEGIGFFELLACIDPRGKWYEVFSCRMNYVQLAHFVSRSRALEFWKVVMEKRGEWGGGLGADVDRDMGEDMDLDMDMDMDMDMGVGVDIDTDGDVVETVLGGASAGSGFGAKHFKKARLALAICMVRRTQLIARTFFDHSLPEPDSTIPCTAPPPVVVPVAVPITDFKRLIYFAKEGQAEDGEEISLKELSDAECVGLAQEKDENAIKRFEEWMGKFKIRFNEVEY
jgi:hypothetical protein